MISLTVSYVKHHKKKGQLVTLEKGTYLSIKDDLIFLEGLI